MTARRACEGPATNATPRSGGRPNERATAARSRKRSNEAPRRRGGAARGWQTRNSKEGGLITALIYTRVSTDEQAREGLSLDAQLADCRRYAAGLGWVLGSEHQDVLKGTRDDRPQYQALLSEVRRLRAEGRAVAVVVAALDRFGRAILERVRCPEELKALGVATHSVREGGEVSDIVANVLAAVAQEEVRRLGERVRATNQYVAAGGWHHCGWAPWGYIWRPAGPCVRLAGLRVGPAGGRGCTRPFGSI